MSSPCHWFTQDEAVSPICIDSSELGTRRLPLNLLIITTRVGVLRKSYTFRYFKVSNGRLYALYLEA